MPRQRSPGISASPQADPPASPTHGLPATRKPGGRGTGARDAAGSLALGSAGLEEGDHGQDATVVIVGLVHIQLGEDAADVFLDGALGDPEAPGNPSVGT